MRLWQSPRVREDANDLLLKEGKKGMSEQDLSQALNQTEEILPPKPNGEAQPKQPTKEQAKQLIEQRNNFAADIAMLALVKLRDEVGYPIQLREVMKRHGFGKREIERALKPAYERLLARKKPAGGTAPAGPPSGGL